MRNVRSNNTNKTDLSGDVVVLDSARKSAPIVEVVDTGSADRLHKRIAEIIAQSSNPDGLTEIINSEVARCVLEIDAWTGKAGAELTKLMPAPAVLTAGASVDLKPHIVVLGVGGAGGNAVNNMIEAGLEGVEFVVANTDAQQLAYSKTQRRIQLGVTVTQGLGSGAHPEIGISAAEESDREIGEHLDGADMVFITAGMGGGTGTGAAPFIAKCARERGILTVGVVTKPFNFEGRHRMRLADAGIAELQRHVDTLIVIPNQNLFRVANERTTFAEAFAMADQVLHAGVRSITDLMVLPGLINLDFADVRTVMAAMGKATIGTGEATGEDRALIAAQSAIANPLLDEVSLKGAKAVLVNVTGGRDMTLLEIDEATNLISDQVDPEANIIFGAAFDPSLDGKIRVSVVATGMGDVPEATVELVERSLVQTATAQPFEPKVMATVLGATPKSLDMPPVMLRVVDPAVTEEGDVSYVDIRSTPLSASPPSPKRERWLSLFGTGSVSGTPSMAATPLDEPRQPRMSVAACIGQAAASDPQPQVESIEADLDIPSFLRRLAN